MNKDTDTGIIYESAVQELREFCEKNTDLQVYILDSEYPFRIQFVPDQQFNLFGNENITEDGEIHDLTVSVGLSTDVRSTLRFKMDASLLKKLIRKAEQVGRIYYHAYREAAEGAENR